jgi:hypothetical protein
MAGCARRLSGRSRRLRPRFEVDDLDDGIGLKAVDEDGEHLPAPGRGRRQDSLPTQVLSGLADRLGSRRIIAAEIEAGQPFRQCLLVD